MSENDLFSDEEISESSSQDGSSLTSEESERSHESDSSDEEENIVKRKPKRMQIVSSDDEEEDRLEVSLLLSPKTRRSMGFHLKNDSEESDVEIGETDVEDNDGTEVEEDEGTEAEDSNANHETELVVPPRKASVSYSLEENTEDETVLKTINYGEENPQEICDLTQDESNDPPNGLPTSRPSSRRTTLGNVRKSTFENSIAKKFSSTIAGIGEVDKLDTVEDDDSVIEIEETPEKVQKVQPTLQNGFKSKSPEEVLVSQSTYEAEVGKIERYDKEINQMLSILKRSAADLPDKGENLRKRVQSLEQEKASMEYILSCMKVDESKSLKKSLQKSIEEDVIFIDEQKNSLGQSQDEIKEEEGAVSIDWDKIKKSNALLQPKYTGKTGLKTFETKMKYMEKGLNQIHGSLATQPKETDMEETPEGLKIELMDHQKTALCWMKWRETCRPRGGILADDMGLGKTLSLIALILSQKESDENSDQDSDEEKSDESVDNWKRKRRSRYQGGTLIVCPASLIGQWEGEIRNRVRSGYLSYEIHHGSRREQKAKRLARKDVVITTYNILSIEIEGNYALDGVRWNRVILDEAHIIRNHKAKLSLATAKLESKYRWALTGTPVCNKEADVFALLRYLKMAPFDDFATYKEFLENKSGGGGTRLHAIIKVLLLRRTKALLQENDKLKLPEREWKLVPIEFTPVEKNVYHKVLSYSQKLFTQFLAEHEARLHGYGVSTGGDRAKESHSKFDKMHQNFVRVQGGIVKASMILTLLLRLRQLCCHPGLISAIIDDEDINSSLTVDDLAAEDLLAKLEKLDLNSSGDDEDVERMSNFLMNKANPVFNLNYPSSKMTAVMNHFEQHILPTSDKVVFVSQWTSFLRLFEPLLHELNVPFVSINGQIPVKDRGEIVNQFNKENKGPRVMLLSLTSGGVGLNLVGANHLYLLDLHWNPQMENQAQDRIYRVGQKKKVFVHKFMVANAMEERVKDIQQRKLDVANGVLTGAKQMGSKLTMNDLKTLFEIK